MRRRVAPRPPREGDQLVPVSHRLVPEQDTRPRLESDPSLSRVMTDGPTGSMPRLGPWPPSRAETEHERRTKRFHRDESDAPRLARSRPGSDDEQARRVGLLLLGKAAVLAHRFERPLAAELDEERECLLQAQ